MIYGIPFIIALVVTPIVRRFAVSKGIIDKVNGDSLKIHKEPVALLGGLAVLIAMIAGMPVVGCHLPVAACFKFIAGALVVFCVGGWDDLKSVKPVIRLLAQVLAGIIVLLAGVRVNFIPVLWVAIPLTLFYIAGAVNAFNMIDGMDGLCAGISLIGCVGFFFVGLKQGNMFLAVLSGMLFMSLLGFLPYNFHPAKIFLGDSGSGFLGFMLGLMAVMATSKPFNIVNFIVPVLMIGVPVFDMAFAILRRMIRKKPLFIGDRDHLYDLLLKKGMTQPQVWGIMCVVQLVFVGTGIMLLVF